MFLERGVEDNLFKMIVG